MAADLDVIVIGAGVAGLAALADLECAGLTAICLEARNRIGGRIHTVHDPLCPVPIELGAEFVHGRPPETWELIRRSVLTAYDCAENSLHIVSGEIQHRTDAWLQIDEILEAMKEAAQTGPDVTFEAFLKTVNQPEQSKQLARSFVEGFNAARADVVGIASLVKESNASDEIDGDCSFRILNGYDSIPIALASRADAIRLNTIIESVGWGRNQVSAHVRSAITGEVSSIRAKRAIVTVPLGVLQTGTVRFDPEPVENLRAARQLCFGQVVRVVLRFRERIWDRNSELGEAGFLLSQGPVFPAWWSSLPVRAPILVGWSAGPKADPLAACERSEIIGRAIHQLSEITRIPDYELRSCLEEVYHHDWATDPFARGAYSYAPVGAVDVRERLAKPVEDTLFFAGEATELNGHAGTVHGAIASGRRAAQEVITRSR